MKWLTTAEAADEMDLSPSTIRRLAEDGELKMRRRTRSGPILISEESVEDYLESLEDSDHPEVEKAYDEGYDAGIRDAECDLDEDEDDDLDDDEDEDEEDD